MMVLRGFSGGAVCFCQLLLMMLASGVDAAFLRGGVLFGMLVSAIFANDAGFWF